MTELAIGVRDGRVIYSFPSPTTEVALDAETARQVAESTARAAYECHYGRPPSSGRSLVGDQIRNRLVTRVMLMLRSMEGRSLGHQSAQLVDTILSELG